MHFSDPWLRPLTAALLLTAVALGSCSSQTSTPASTASFTIKTPAIAVAANKEKYVCYAQTLDRDLAIDQFDYSDVPFVHHIFFSRTLAPEPDGVSECDVLFKTTWVPLFITGKATNTLKYPAGAASVLPKGTQLVVQMHLLNASVSDGSVSVAIAMHATNTVSPRPVGLYAFGTEVISLAANAKSAVSYECTPQKDVTSFADFPHMHKLGTVLTLELADEAGTYHELYRRDPYDFNNQFFDSMPIQVPKGRKTRITCSYDNTTAAPVGYGESTTNEMCFLGLFVEGQEGVAGCVKGSESNSNAGTDAGTCAPTANSLGVGAACSAGGGECPSPLQCSTDLSPSSNPAGFCIKVGCSAAADCGSGATCCAPANGGGIKVCLPTACLPPECHAN